MKKILFGIGIASLIGFSSCEDKNETVIRPEAENGTLTFELHTPENASTVYELLEENESLVAETFTFDKPEYGFSTAATYSMEVSLEPEFEKTKTQALNVTSTREVIEVTTKELNNAIRKLHALGEYPALTDAQDVYFRVKSVISNATSGPLDPNPIVKPAYSGSVLLSVLAYEPQQSALPATYYIIGIGGWDNNPNAIGSCLIPLSIVPGYEYDPTDGKGVFEYTGYFEAATGFKLISTPGDWEEQWGMVDGEFVFKDGGSGNINVPADGFYKLTLDTEANTLALTAADVTYTAYEWIELIGVYNGWSDDTQRLQRHAGAKNMWFTDIDLTVDGGIKFRANGTWDMSWGGKTFPFALQPSGDDIPATEGSYRVVFNQQDGCYFFFKK